MIKKHLTRRNIKPIDVKENYLTQIMLIYLSYLRAFRNHSNKILNKSSEFKQIGNYANTITEKANQLLKRAALNKRINLSKLQTEMFKQGGICIKKFSDKYRTSKNTFTDSDS